MTAMDVAALRLVDGYRANWSHRKGFRCAAGVAGHGTCSTVIRRNIAEKGLLASVVPAMDQFRTCATSAWRIRRGPQGPGGPRFAGGGPGFGAGPQRRASVQGVCCCGPIPIPFSF